MIELIDSMKSGVIDYSIVKKGQKLSLKVTILIIVKIYERQTQKCLQFLYHSVSFIGVLLKKFARTLAMKMQ